jgi:hypothetical protein
MRDQRPRFPWLLTFMVLTLALVIGAGAAGILMR